MAKSLSKAKVSTFKLNALLDITLAINNNEPIKDLAGRLNKILTEDLMIGKVMILKLGNNSECILNSGFSDDFFEKLDTDDLLESYKEISFITSDPDSFNERVDIVMPVLEKNEPIAYVLIGDIDEEGEGMSPILKHLRYIQTLANIIVVAIENKRLFEESLRQEALKREMELASKMQSMLIPEKEQLPYNDCIKMYAFYHPHFDVGGDYYDVIRLNDEEFGFCIADVSGKGISAAILMSNFQANLQALYTEHISLEELIERLNKRVLDSANGEKFITLFLGRYNCRTKVLNYVNAGHNPPILYRMNSKKILQLKNGAVGMGMLDELPFLEIQTVKMDEPSKMLCFTDGLVEIIEDSEVETGTAKLEIELRNNDSIEKNVESIIKKQRIMEGNESIFDDISILSAQFPG